MGRKNLAKRAFILFFALFVIPGFVNAVVNGTRTTYDTFANGSASTSLGNYGVAFGSLEGIGTQMNCFSNESATVLFNTTTGSASSVSRSCGHFNDSIKAGASGKIVLRSGFNASTIQQGMACDIQFKFDGVLSQSGTELGLSAVNGIDACAINGKGDACVGIMNDASLRIAIDIFSVGFTAFGHKPLLGETVNVTLIY